MCPAAKRKRPRRKAKGWWVRCVRCDLVVAAAVTVVSTDGDTVVDRDGDLEVRVPAGALSVVSGVCSDCALQAVEAGNILEVLGPVLAARAERAVAEDAEEKRQLDLDSLSYPVTSKES